MLTAEPGVDWARAAIRGQPLDSAGHRAEDRRVVAARWLQGSDLLTTMPTSPRHWLLRLARAIRSELSQTAVDPLVTLYASGALATMETDTDGWFVVLGRVSGMKGNLAVWLDSFPNASSRRVSVCFQSTNADVVRKIANAATGGQPLVLKDDIWERRDGVSQMVKPLAAAKFGHPVFEPYEKGGAWKFYTVYLREAPKTFAKPKTAMVAAAAAFLGLVTRAACGLSSSSVDLEYSKVERKKVQTHKVRERSSKLALAAKVRDGFTCQVCRFNFAACYGEIGHGFAETHHRLPLASAASNKPTRVADLITVCANCHRMLHHRPASHAGDLVRLRTALTGWWPGQA
jgi:hypothetical protein